MQQMTLAQAEFTKFLATLAFRNTHTQSQLSAIKMKMTTSAPVSTETKVLTNSEE